MNKTTVEWLVENLIPKPNWVQRKVIEQAKEMEEELAFKHFQAGQKSMEEGGKSFDQYYAKTFKSE
jgi:hypothetical protein